ncbi:MAG TPA: NUDIX hydrolase [Anaerolineae bacterium]|nr:NUDIX hydrolase [Anaerolineae bacterium]
MQDDKSTWKIIESCYLVQDRWMTLRADRCEMPNGVEIAPYYVIESADFVHIVAITNENEVVLIRQYRHAIGRTILEIPAGTVDKESDPLLAAQRELLEETGYAGGTWQILPTTLPNPARFDNTSHCYLATGVTKIAQQTLDDTEQIECVLMPLAEVVKGMAEGLFEQTLNVTTLFYALIAFGKLEM